MYTATEVKIIAKVIYNQILKERTTYDGYQGPSIPLIEEEKETPLGLFVSKYIRKDINLWELLNDFGPLFDLPEIPLNKKAGPHVLPLLLEHLDHGGPKSASHYNAILLNNISYSARITDEELTAVAGWYRSFKSFNQYIKELIA